MHAQGDAKGQKGRLESTKLGMKGMLTLPKLTLTCSEHSVSEDAEEFWAEVFRRADRLHAVFEMIITKLSEYTHGACCSYLCGF